MAPKFKIQRSHEGKKQVIAYLSVDQAAIIYDYARTHRLTNQETLAAVVNHISLERGHGAILEEEKTRIIRRSAYTTAAVKLEGGAVPGCRIGKVAVAGWFRESNVDRLREFSSQAGMPIQKIIEEGVLKISSPPENPDWKP